MTDAPFSRRAVRWLVGVCVVSFVAALLLAVFAPSLERLDSSGADSYSWSALGHRAFASVLKRVGVPVVSSRFASAARASGGILVVADPPVYGSMENGDSIGEATVRLLESADRVLLVLPKWHGDRRREEQGWVTTVTAISESRIEELLEEIGIEANVDRVASDARFSPTGLTSPPAFPTPVAQVFEAPGFSPLLSSGRGMLVGERVEDDHHLIVLADPDLLCNAGLHLGHNAELVIEAVERLREPGGAVVIDETLHGFERSPSIWRELFSFPLVLVLLHAGLMVGVMLWAGMGRFGSPTPPAPPLEPGQRFLIRNTADLLRHGNRTQAVLERALDDSIRELRTLRGVAPDDTDPELAALRRATATLSPRAGRGPRALQLARRIHDWKQEIIHGPRGRT